jgi:hypothetical protein
MRSIRRSIPIIPAGGGSASNAAGTSAGGALNGADLARAFALYQSQLEQRLLAGISATQTASII